MWSGVVIVSVVSVGGMCVSAVSAELCWDRGWPSGKKVLQKKVQVAIGILLYIQVHVRYSGLYTLVKSSSTRYLDLSVLLMRC